MRIRDSIQSVEIISGRFFTDSDIANRSKVAIVGTYIVQELYAGLDPVGETIKLNGQPFTVIGVYKAVSYTHLDVYKRQTYLRLEILRLRHRSIL